MGSCASHTSVTVASRYQSTNNYYPACEARMELRKMRMRMRMLSCMVAEDAVGSSLRNMAWQQKLERKIPAGNEANSGGGEGEEWLWMGMAMGCCCCCPCCCCLYFAAAAAPACGSFIFKDIKISLLIRASDLKLAIQLPCLSHWAVFSLHQHRIIMEVKNDKFSTNH